MEDFKMKYKYFKKSLSVVLTAIMIFGMIGTPQSPGVLVEEVEASNSRWRCGDVNGDGVITIADSTEILNHVARWTPNAIWHYSTATQHNYVGYWDSRSLNIYTRQLTTNANFVTGMNEARTQWGNELGITFNNVAVSSNTAQIRAYGGTYQQVKEHNNNQWSYDANGNANIGLAQFRTRANCDKNKEHCNP
jgi:hypothetical protein